MKAYSDDVAAQYAAGRINTRLAVRFDLPSGRYGFVTGTRGNLEYGGALYVGSGGLIAINVGDEAVSAEADEVTVDLASHQIINGKVQQLFAPHLLVSIEAEVWYLQTAVLSRFHFDDARRLIDVEQIDIRKIWDVRHTRTANGGRRITAVLRTPAALAKVVEAKRNGPDLQAQIDAADTGYRDILTALSDPIYWGRSAPKAKK